MSLNPRLTVLLDRHLDGCLTADDAVELNRILAESESARNQFWKTAAIHARLRQWGEQQLGKQWAIASESPARARRVRLWLPGATFLAASLLLGIAALAWWRPGSDPSDPAGRTVAVFGPQEKVVCSNGDQLREGGAIHAGQRLELASGTSRIDFPNGATITLVGPAQFEVESEQSVFLSLGQLLAKAETKGMTVRTLTTRVDKGTDFTAGVAADGVSRVGVVSGNLEVSAREVRHQLHPGDQLLVEPGAAKVVVRIERGDDTPAFRFPSIESPTDRDYADLRQGHATAMVVAGELVNAPPVGASAPPSVLLDGRGQTSQDAPLESVFFKNNTSGRVRIDLGRPVTVSKINTFSWHQNWHSVEWRHRSVQKYTVYGSAADRAPTAEGDPETAGWVRIARVDTDEFFGVVSRLDRPAQQACSITAAAGPIGRFRYLMWDCQPNRFADFKPLHHSFYGEFDIYADP